MQHEITSRAPLLDAAGNLREAGYAKRLLPVYDRAAIRAGAARIKEWDYYLVANDHLRCRPDDRRQRVHGARLLSFCTS